MINGLEHFGIGIFRYKKELAWFGEALLIPWHGMAWHAMACPTIFDFLWALPRDCVYVIVPIILVSNLAHRIRV